MKVIAAATGLTIPCIIIMYFGFDAGFGVGAIFGAWTITGFYLWDKKNG